MNLQDEDSMIRGDEAGAPADSANIKQKKFYKQKNFWLGAGSAAVLFIFFSFSVSVLRDNSFLGGFVSAFNETLGDVFGSNHEKPIYEFDLATGEGRDLAGDGESKLISESKEDVPVSKTGSASKNSASVQSLVSLKTEKSVMVGSDKGKKESTDLKNPQTSEKLPNDNLVVEKKIETPARDCEFSTGNPSAGGPDRRISFNEIAWMGGLSSANDEWVELKNNSGAEINLAGWQIKNQSEKIKIIFDADEKIVAGGFLLFERTDDNSVSNVVADKIYSGAFSNESEWLKLYDADCDLVDEVNASWGWGSFGGENATKKTLERNLNDFAWHTSVSSGGTPKAVNSVPVLVSGSGGAAGEDSDSENSSSSSTPAGPQDSTSSPPVVQNPAAMKILISEVMAGSSASVGDEFIEIYNYGSEPADLTGWTIKKKTSSGAESALVATSRLEGKIIPAGKYFLLAHEGGYAGAAAADVLWPSSYSLAYTNNSITIYNGSGAVIDAVSWAEIPKDKSYLRQALDISAGFTVSDTPGPQNSQE